MKTKQLGNSDLFITPVGFGAWAIGGAGWEFAWGEQDDKASIAAILGDGSVDALLRESNEMVEDNLAGIERIGCRNDSLDDRFAGGNNLDCAA